MKKITAEIEEKIIELEVRTTIEETEEKSKSDHQKTPNKERRKEVGKTIWSEGVNYYLRP